MFVLLKMQPPPPEEQLLLRDLPLSEYYRSPWWQERRRFQMEWAGSHCQLCGGTKGGVQIHHRTYTHLACEPLEDLLVLCDSCHEQFSERIKRQRGVHPVAEQKVEAQDMPSVNEGLNALFSRDEASGIAELERRLAAARKRHGL